MSCQIRAEIRQLRYHFLHHSAEADPIDSYVKLQALLVPGP